MCTLPYGGQMIETSEYEVLVVKSIPLWGGLVEAHIVTLLNPWLLTLDVEIKISRFQVVLQMLSFETE